MYLLFKDKGSDDDDELLSVAAESGCFVVADLQHRDDLQRWQL